jgi:hypothetical protein
MSVRLRPPAPLLPDHPRSVSTGKLAKDACCVFFVANSKDLDKTGNRMFCPTCGSADQQPDSYCRSCGEFVTNQAATSHVVSTIFGGSTPSTQINVNLAINLLTIVACFLLIGFLNGHYDAQRARTGEAPPTVIYLVYAFLLTISAWQIFSLIVGVRLRGKLGRKKKDDIVSESNRPASDFGPATARELPPGGEVPPTTPPSVTEDRTRILKQPSRR